MFSGLFGVCPPPPLSPLPPLTNVFSTPPFVNVFSFRSTQRATANSAGAGGFICGRSPPIRQSAFLVSSSRRFPAMCVCVCVCVFVHISGQKHTYTYTYTL